MQHFAHNIWGFFSPQDFDFYRWCVNQAPTPSHFVEVGSYHGRSTCFMAVEILNSGKQIKFDCVDTWQGSEEHQKGALFEDATVVQGTLYHSFLRNIAAVRQVVLPIRMTSVEASTLYDDDSLDWVFLDAGHDYENVYQDLIHWLPKVKTGGILSGHDWPHQDIQRALQDVLTLPVYQHGDACWWVRIP
jgi:cephalosporin hydroxylase